MKDIRTHWAEWRAGWEHKLAQNEMQFLRSVADLQGAFQHRVTLMEASHRDLMRAQHADFNAALERQRLRYSEAPVGRPGEDALELERTIHSELRLIRQRAQMAAPAAASTAPAPIDAGARGRPPLGLRLRALRRTLPRLGGTRQGRAAVLSCRISRAARTCWISAAAAASFWN